MICPVEFSMIAAFSSMFSEEAPVRSAFANHSVAIRPDASAARPPGGVPPTAALTCASSTGCGVSGAADHDSRSLCSFSAAARSRSRNASLFRAFMFASSSAGIFVGPGTCP